MRLRIAPLLFAALAIVVSACGSDATILDTGSEEGTASATTVPEAEPTDTTVETIEPSLPGGPALVSAEDLTVDHPCGFGFAKGSADQTIALVIFFTGPWTEDGPSLETVELGPGSDWSARINIGADLFANWCDDVIEEDEPTPRIDQEYEITQGTLVGEVDGSFALGSLRNAVAEPVTGEGEILEFPEIQLANDGWGFFAG